MVTQALQNGFDYDKLRTYDANDVIKFLREKGYR